MPLKNWFDSVSLVSRGVRNQFAVAIVLMSLIPLCVLAYIIVDVIPNQSMTLDMLKVVTLVVFVVAILGWFLLFKYPINIMRLRQYLDTLASGGLPKKIDIEKVESDLAAIEQNMSRIVIQTEDRIKTIETQMQILLENERQRVVIESLGAACHHLGQPATVINTYLGILEKHEASDENREMIQKCKEASHEITEILNKLQRINEYRTEPYLTSSKPADADRDADHILKI